MISGEIMYYVFLISIHTHKERKKQNLHIVYINLYKTQVIKYKTCL